ncbi:MAG: NUDIX domain-containing protein [Rikenellaceae bacterium]
MQDNGEELFPIVESDGKVVGSATRAKCHGGSMLLHPVVHLQLYNSKGEIYLQRRPAWKDIQPGMWDTAVGGHVDYGEKVEDALRREAMEELGIADFSFSSVGTYVFKSPIERELVYSFRTTYDGVVTPSAELDGGRFWTPEEVDAAISKGGILTKNFTMEWERQRIFGKVLGRLL